MIGINNGIHNRNQWTRFKEDGDWNNLVTIRESHLVDGNARPALVEINLHLSPDYRRWLKSSLA